MHRSCISKRLLYMPHMLPISTKTPHPIVHNITSPQLHMYVSYLCDTIRAYYTHSVLVVDHQFRGRHIYFVRYPPAGGFRWSGWTDVCVYDGCYALSMRCVYLMITWCAMRTHALFLIHCCSPCSRRTHTHIMMKQMTLFFWLVCL